MNRRRVVGRWVRPDGTPAAGTLEFAPAARTRETEPAGVVLTGPAVTATLDPAGTFGIDLRTTDSTDPAAPWVWVLTERVGPGSGRWVFTLPAALDPLDLTAAGVLEPLPETAGPVPCAGNPAAVTITVGGGAGCGDGSVCFPWVPSEDDLPSDAEPGAAWLVGNPPLLFITPDPDNGTGGGYVTTADLNAAVAALAPSGHTHPAPALAVADIDGLPDALAALASVTTVDALAQMVVSNYQDMADAVNTVHTIETEHYAEIVAALTELANTTNLLTTTPPSGPIIVQTGPPPEPSGDTFTPRDLLALWEPYPDGLHLFPLSTLVHLRRTGDNLAGRQLDLSITGPGWSGSAVIRDWGDGPSWYMAWNGPQIMVLRSPSGPVPFGPPTFTDLTAGPGGGDDSRAAATAEAVFDFLTPGEWVPVGLTNGSQDTLTGLAPCMMRFNAGRIELRGQFAAPTTGGYRSPVFRITNPGYRPGGGTTQPVAVWEDKVAARTGYLSVSEDGTASVQGSGGNWNRVSLDGVWWPAQAGQVPNIRPAARSEGDA